MKILISLLLIFFLCLSNLSIAQSSQKGEISIKRNGIFISAATSLFWIEANINYELIFLQQTRNKTIGFGLQTGFGLYGVAFDDSGQVFNPKLVLLAGGNHKYFEFAAGANLFTEIDTYYWSSEFVPAGCVGFRSHGKEGKSLLRIGIGWPMGIYFALGGRF